MINNNTKDCSSVRVLLSSYIDNELDDQQSEFVTEHVSNCSKCKNELVLMYKMVGMISSVYEPKESSSIDLSNKIMTKIRYNKAYKSNNKKNIKSKLTYIPAIAVAMLLSIGGTLVYFQDNQIENSSAVSLKPVALEQQEQTYENYALEHYKNSYSEVGANNPIISVNFEK